MKSKFTLGLGAAMLLSLSAMTAGTAFAASTINSPGTAGTDTTQLNYTGQGTTGGQFNSELCGDNADPGSGGFQNGADANNYILWIFNSKATTSSEVLHVNGDTYDAAGLHQIVTPAYDLSTIDAYMTFTTSVGGHMVLTISHGCGGGEQDQQINATGTIGGPCADPAYYAVFDNTGSNVPIRFRMTWFNTHGFNVVSKWVPAGQTYTTFQHWAKPGTVVRISYKDPNTLLWVPIDSLTVVHGVFPACDVQPGFGSPS